MYKNHEVTQYRPVSDEDPIIEIEPLIEDGYYDYMETAIRNGESMLDANKDSVLYHFKRVIKTGLQVAIESRENGIVSSHLTPGEKTNFELLQTWIEQALIDQRTDYSDEWNEATYRLLDARDLVAFILNLDEDIVKSDTVIGCCRQILSLIDF